MYSIAIKKKLIKLLDFVSGEFCLVFELVYLFPETHKHCVVDGLAGSSVQSNRQ